MFGKAHQLMALLAIILALFVAKKVLDRNPSTRYLAKDPKDLKPVPAPNNQARRGSKAKIKA